MNASIISKENNKVKFTFQADGAAFEEGLKYAYNKNKKNISVPGFRKGKVPRKIVEAQYGEGVFYDDAINFVLNEKYADIVKELGLDVVSRPEIDVKEINKETGVEFEIEVTVKPEVKLGDYKGVEITKTETAVTDEELDRELNSVREKNAREVSVSDRAAKDGDICNISYLGTVDGVAFDGGQSDSYDLTLGSKTFIDGFEEQIAGHSVGDKFDVNVKFPDEYHSKELAGKDAVFAVELKAVSVKELPELNDEFAQDVSDFDTLAEYKADIVGKLTEAKAERAAKEKEEKLLDAIVANAEMDLPEVMVDNKIDQLVRDFEQNIGRNGLSLEVYCQYMGVTLDGLKEQFRGTAEKSVKARLVLEQIAKEEGMTVTKEETEEKIKELGESWGLDPEKALEIFAEEDINDFNGDILARKAMELVEANCVEK